MAWRDDRQRQFVGGDAAAVVADADQAHAAFLQVDVDAARAGIERVLDQFLDHGRGPFDDLAGGDLVDQGVGELADRHGGERRVRRRRMLDGDDKRRVGSPTLYRLCAETVALNRPAKLRGCRRRLRGEAERRRRRVPHTTCPAAAGAVK